MTNVSGAVLFLLSGFAAGQVSEITGADVASAAKPSQTIAVPAEPGDASHMSHAPLAPALALEAYEKRASLQEQQLQEYSDVTIIHAELPDMLEKGDYELQRHFLAPGTLQFIPISSDGDGFVKHNVILRLLKEEKDRLQTNAASSSAIVDSNYKFSYVGAGKIEDRPVQVFEAKPRVKRVGLFKGRIYLDPFTGSLVRSEGVLAKSSSFFIKKVRFVNDYADIGRFTFPMKVHIAVIARIVGHAVIDIYHQNYEAAPAERASGDPEHGARPDECGPQRFSASSRPADCFGREFDK